MTSPVDTSVKFFTNAMLNAPALSGTAGSMVALLTACLVDGFDTKDLTSLTASGGVMTAAFTGSHSAVPDCVVLVSGVSGGPTGYAGANGEQKVVARPSGTTMTWATALPDGTYTGTISLKIAPLGWARTFTGTNKATYKPTDPAANGMTLRVDDSATTMARVVGYEQMIDIDTGLGPFPTAAQFSGGGYWAKSNVANTVPVSWAIVGDSRLFYLSVQPYSSVASGYQQGWVRGFGDLQPLKPGGDAFATALSFSTNATPANAGDGSWSSSGEFGTVLPRSYTGLGGSVYHKIFPFIGAADTQQASGAYPLMGSFPSPVDGALWLSQKYVASAWQQPARAVFPGLLHVLQSEVWNSIKHGDFAPGTGAFAGRRLMGVNATASTVFSSISNSSNTGVILIDVTGPWAR